MPPRSHRLSAAPTLAVGAALGLLALAWAQPAAWGAQLAHAGQPAAAAPPPWLGHFQLLPESSDDAAQAVERLVSEAPRMWAPPLVARLKRTVAPPTELMLNLLGTKLRVDAQGRPPLMLVLDGPAQRLVGSATGPREGKAWREGDTLVVRLSSPTGSQTLRFEASPLGLLTEHSVALPAARHPLRIHSAYRRL